MQNVTIALIVNFYAQGGKNTIKENIYVLAKDTF